MNKSTIKSFAISARKKLIEQVKQQAFNIGITATKNTELKEVDGHIILSGIPQEKSFKYQRNKLIQEINQKEYEQVMEEVAYTWFNRFIALRFMEINDYLPTGVRVLSSIDPQKAEPDIIREALNIDLYVDRNKIYDFQDRNDTEGLYKYLLIHQCNAISNILPFMFEKIADFTELLFPGNVLQEGSVIRNLVTSIDDADWKEVEIIGWLYQYYISEKKDEVFADLKKNKKITKENIPAATQLFTPKWIVQYMVENSLGRLWQESHPNEDLKAQWKYFLEEAEQEPDVQKQLEELKNPNLNPLDIKLLDPCCGSGHILVYAFDVLYEIYKSYGYMEDDISKLILENNIFGLDIDDRAAQLASFAVMMKARGKNLRVFNQDIKLNICAIQESNWMSKEVIELLDDNAGTAKYLTEIFKDAKEYGSILDIKEFDLSLMEKKLTEIESTAARNILEFSYRELIIEKLPNIIQQAKIMGAKYDVVCTNPPYMGRGGMNNNLTEYVKKNFLKSKSDMFACCIERGFSFTNKNGFVAMVTMESWMFLSSYEEFRKDLVMNKTIQSLVHMPYLGKGGTSMGISFGTSAFIIRNRKTTNYNASYSYTRYYEIDDDGVPYKFPTPNERLAISKTENFYQIPGSPIAYWASEGIMEIFAKDKLENYATPLVGMFTTDNNKFLRMWWEVRCDNIGFNIKSKAIAKESNFKWFLYNKGGAFRRWFGNAQHIVNYKNDGAELKKLVVSKYPYLKGNYDFVLKTDNPFFDEGITWSDVSSNKFASRYTPNGFMFDVKGSSMFPDKSLTYYLLAFLNSKFAMYCLTMLNPTMSFQIGNIKSIPLILSKSNKESIDKKTEQNIFISKQDWDSFETSWDFNKHPIIVYKKEATVIEQAFTNWADFAKNQYNQLKANEEELNRIFIEIYGLRDELTPEVEDKDVTIRKADRERDIKSFISYAVGCMMGRYSLDKEGLIFAGGSFDPNKYKTFQVDEDGILPILDDVYFDDDIVSKFAEFVKITFGENTLAQNLDYIAETLGRKATETSRECIRRYFIKDFYKDHVQTYKKRPIYWLFTSGKEQGFNALMYLHRYDSSTVSRVRTDYLHQLQNKLEAEFQHLNYVLISDDSVTEKSKATKKLKVLTKQMEELKKYDEIIHHVADQQIELDLDDGVVVNYAKLQDVLAKI